MTMSTDSASPIKPAFCGVMSDNDAKQLAILRLRDFEVAALASARVEASFRNAFAWPVILLLRPFWCWSKSCAGLPHSHRLDTWQGNGNRIEQFVVSLAPLTRFAWSSIKNLVLSLRDWRALAADPFGFVFSIVAFILVILILLVFTLTVMIFQDIFKATDWIKRAGNAATQAIVISSEFRAPEAWVKSTHKELSVGPAGSTGDNDIVLSPAIAQLTLLLASAIYQRDAQVETQAGKLYNSRALVVGKSIPREPIIVQRSRDAPGVIELESPEFHIPHERLELGKELQKVLLRADEAIDRSARKLGLNYQTVSELDTGFGGSFCGFFIPSERVSGCDDFLVVTFKGTTPTDPTEFIVDADFTKTDASEYLAGKCHTGFYTSLFPSHQTPRRESRADEETAASSSPYSRIMQALRFAIRAMQRSAGPNRTVRIYVTGHSLGAALATLFYARLLLHPEDLDGLNNVELAPLHVYGSPAVGDTEFAKAFSSAAEAARKSARASGKGVERDIGAIRIIDRDDVVTRAPPNFNGSGVGHDRRNIFVKAGSIFDYVQVGTGCRVYATGMPAELSSRTELLPFKHHHIDVGLGTSHPFSSEPPTIILRLLSHVPIISGFVNHSGRMYNYGIQRTFRPADSLNGQ
ncbi:hypothetical protein PYCC9005_003276 [Savitreella phatthalungensis]